MGYTSTLESGDVNAITTDVVVSAFVGIGLFALFIGGMIALVLIFKALPIKVGK